MNSKGLILIYTGDGKGKTCASLGQGIRALGQGFNVCFMQFIKGKWSTGEGKFFKSTMEKMEFHTLGSGFTWDEDSQKTKEVALKAWEFAQEKIISNVYDMIILDELTYLINYDLVDEQQIIDALLEKPHQLHIVISGRSASKKLVEIADLVSEIQPIKHPYSKGIKAQKGIEF